MAAGVATLAAVRSAGGRVPVTACRKTLKGVIIAPTLFMWNVEKT
jgi:hypothetical protein